MGDQNCAIKSKQVNSFFSGGCSAMLNYSNWKFSCLNYWKSMNSCPAIFAQPFMKLGECLPGSNFTLIWSSYAAYIKWLDALISCSLQESMRMIWVQITIGWVLLLIMRPLLNFQYWQKVLYFPATRRFPEIHIVVYNKKRLSIGYKY